MSEKPAFRDLEALLMTFSKKMKKRDKTPLIQKCEHGYYSHLILHLSIEKNKEFWNQKTHFLRLQGQFIKFLISKYGYFYK